MKRGPSAFSARLRAGAIPTTPLAEELGMRPLIARCHLGLSKLCRHTGDRAKAGEYVTIARAMYGAMGMGFPLAQAETV